MKCAECKTKYTEKTVCPDCIRALRPWQISTVGIVLFIMAGLSLLGAFSGEYMGIISGLVTGLIAFLLMRMSPFGIGISMLRVGGGIIAAIIGLMSLNAEPLFTDTSLSEPDSLMLASMQIQYWSTIVLHAVLVIFLFSRPSWKAFELARSSQHKLQRLSLKENEALE